MGTVSDREAAIVEIVRLIWKGTTADWQVAEVIGRDYPVQAALLIRKAAELVRGAHTLLAKTGPH